jgi:serine/threonine protein kinase
VVDLRPDVVDLESSDLDTGLGNNRNATTDSGVPVGSHKGFELAVKVIHLRGMRLSTDAGREVQKLQRELGILRSLPPHPRIVRLVDQVEDDDWMFIVLELLRRGDLFGILMERPGPAPRLLEREASHIFWQLVEALQFLHSRDVIHRDLKLENVLIASERRSGPSILYDVKISDFG